MITDPVVINGYTQPGSAQASAVDPAVLRIEPASEREMEHSAEDLKHFVEESGEDAVTETERDILINALELNDLKVLDIVTPRSEVIALDIRMNQLLASLDMK